MKNNTYTAATTSTQATMVYWSAVMIENKRERAKEDLLEAVYGVPFERCPICDGRRKNYMLGKAWAYCGVVEK